MGMRKVIETMLNGADLFIFFSSLFLKLLVAFCQSVRLWKEIMLEIYSGRPSL